MSDIGSSFLAGSPARPGVRVDAQSLRQPLRPLRRPERPTTPQRTPHGRPFGLPLRRAHLGTPPTPTLRLGSAQSLSLGERTEQGVIVAQAVVLESRPAVSEHDHQVLVIRLME